MNKVTIITPVYNDSNNILTAIKSIENQSYTNWEYIIVDDCSTDNTYNIIKTYLKHSKNKHKIKLFKNKKNCGPYFCKNFAIKRSKGVYINVLDSDDIFHPNKIQKQVNILNNNQNIICVNTMCLRKDIGCHIGSVTCMYRRKVIHDIGFYDSVRFGADSEFRRRINAYYGEDSIYTINKVLYIAKNRENSLKNSKITGNMTIRNKYKQNYKKWHNYAKKNKSLYMPFPLNNKKRPFSADKTMLFK